MSVVVVQDTNTIVVTQKVNNVVVNGVGVQGPKGDAGASGDLSYTHNQAGALAVWTITHNLGKFPTPSVVTTAGDEINPSIKQIDNNTIELTFSSAYAGKAYLN